MAAHRVRVGPLPAWLDRDRLLGGGTWSWDGVFAEAVLPTRDAADLAARLRGLGFGGRAVAVQAEPPLPRAAVRAARTEDARRRRDTTPGFERPGARLDAEGRISLTPERLALALAHRAARAHPGATVLDAGCGAGGNAVAFARAGLPVIAVERDAARLADARHNAVLYGVTARIRFVHADAVEAAATEAAELLFVDPPWGTAYDRVRTARADLPLLDAVLPHAHRFAAVWLKLPPSFDPTTLPGDWAVEAVFGEAPGDRQRVKLLLARR